MAETDYEAAFRVDIAGTLSLTHTALEHMADNQDANVAFVGSETMTTSPSSPVENSGTEQCAQTLWSLFPHGFDPTASPTHSRPSSSWWVSSARRTRIGSRPPER